MIAYMNYEGVILVVGFPPSQKKFLFIHHGLIPQREKWRLLSLSWEDPPR